MQGERSIAITPYLSALCLPPLSGLANVSSLFVVTGLHFCNLRRKSRVRGAVCLRLAQENWKVQLEPRDARIFLEAALAMKDSTAAQPVLAWLADSHIEDRYLISLAHQLKEGRK